MINRHIGIVETCYGLQVISNKCQLFCTCEQSAGGKRGGMVLVCESLNKYVTGPATMDQVGTRILTTFFTFVAS